MLKNLVQPKHTVGSINENRMVITNTAAVGSPSRAESEIFWNSIVFYWKSWVTFVAGEPLCDLETPS